MRRATALVVGVYVAVFYVLSEAGARSGHSKTGFGGKDSKITARLAAELAAVLATAVSKLLAVLQRLVIHAVA